MLSNADSKSVPVPLSKSSSLSQQTPTYQCNAATMTSNAVSYRVVALSQLTAMARNPGVVSNPDSTDGCADSSACFDSAPSSHYACSASTVSEHADTMPRRLSVPLAAGATSECSKPIPYPSTIRDDARACPGSVSSSRSAGTCSLARGFISGRTLQQAPTPSDAGTEQGRAPPTRQVVYLIWCLAQSYFCQELSMGSIGLLDTWKLCSLQQSCCISLFQSISFSQATMHCFHLIQFRKLVVIAAHFSALVHC